MMTYAGEIVDFSFDIIFTQSVIDLKNFQNYRSLIDIAYIIYSIV